MAASSIATATPFGIESESDLDARLTEPTPALVEFIPQIRSPLVLIGAGGKMGPSLAVLARRAAQAAGHDLRIIAVSRFTNPASAQWLEDRGVEVHRADVLDPTAVAPLPDSPNVFYLVGLKFGTAQNPAATWAMNTVAPWQIAQRYRDSRMVALSTGNVYPMTPVRDGGATESHPLTPLGEYPNAAVARERLLQFASQQNQTPMALLRLFYAVELRYGVVGDIARFIHTDTPIPLANGSFNCIWQRDANEMVLRSLALATAPPSVWNLCLPEVFSVRHTALRLAEQMNRTPRFIGEEAPTALLGNSKPLCAQLGPPSVGLNAMIEWTASWVRRGGLNWNRPTHFEIRDGQY